MNPLDAAINDLTARFHANFGSLIFRRVADVVHDSEATSLQYTYRGLATNPDDRIISTSNGRVENVRSFHGTTLPLPAQACMRATDSYIGQPIFFSSDKYAEIDFVQSGDMSFNYIPTHTPPRSNKGMKLWPDLLCGLVERDASGKLHFVKWFLCSPQFMQLWIVIMLPHSDEAHRPTKGRRNPNHFVESDTLKWLMSGDRLCVNNFNKWVISNNLSETIGPNVNPKDIDPYIVSEINRRYWRLRSESLCRQWVHTYAAIALIIRFRTLPDSTNIPTPIGLLEKKMPRWDLPDLFVEKLLLFSEAEEMEEDYSDLKEEDVIPVVPINIVGGGITTNVVNDDEFPPLS